jgi:hypothetical protein
MTIPQNAKPPQTLRPDAVDPHRSSCSDAASPSFKGCFSEQFLAQQKFDEYYAFPGRDGKLVKMLCNHRRYNTPPFSYFDPKWPRTAFLITGSNYAVVDLDKCFHDGQPKPWAQAFLRKWTQRTAHEVSVSGSGAHLLFNVSEEIPVELHGIHQWDSDDNDGKAELFVNRKWIAHTGKPIFSVAHPEVLQISIAELRDLMQELQTIRPERRAFGGLKSESDGTLPEMDSDFDIDAFLGWLDIPVRRTDANSETTFFRLVRCPWSTEDADSTHCTDRCMTNPSITFGGTLGFSCFHPSCSKRGICC